MSLKIKLKKILWLEDQLEDLEMYRSKLFRKGYVVDMVRSVSEALDKLSKEDYLAYIFDLMVIPGDKEEWRKLDEEKREKDSNFDSLLGLELLSSLFDAENAKIQVALPRKIESKRMIIMSNVQDKMADITAMGIPADQIKYKSDSNLSTLLQIIEKIENGVKK
jgi:CheY-like chemotaxis protein